MLEDVVVTRRHLGSDAALCTVCGAPYPVHLLQPMEGYPGAGIRSAFIDICPECDVLFRLGDDPLIPLAAEVRGGLERRA